MGETAHIPTPWRIAGKGTIRSGKNDWVCSVHWNRREATAAFLVRAANVHDELVSALKTVLAQYELFVGPDDAIANATRKVARDALAKAAPISLPYAEQGPYLTAPKGEL